MMNEEETLKIETVRTWLAASKRTVFFGGAGVSTGSGIPDFRGTAGLYASPDETFTDPPEYLLSSRCMRLEPEKFYRCYRTHMLCPGAKPNAAHLVLAKAEAEGRLFAVVTQNIDGLHEAAGSKNIYDLHGTSAVNYCVKCRRRYETSFVAESAGIPRCECGGMVRPDVVMYGEGLDDRVFAGAEAAMDSADLLIVAGTSLVVYPAAGLVEHTTAGHIVFINLTPTPLDSRADLILRGDLVDLLVRIFA